MQARWVTKVWEPRPTGERPREVRGPKIRGLVCGWRPEGLEDRCSASSSIEAERAEESIPEALSATVWGVKRALPWLLGVAILTAVLVIGLSQAGGRQGRRREHRAAVRPAARPRSSSRAPPRRWPRCTSSPPSCSSGGVPAFEQRLAALKGTPVVINKWASWCDPCRAEFPVFQRARHRARPRDRVPRRQRPRQHRAGEEVPAPVSRSRSRPTSTRTRRSRRRSRRRRTTRSRSSSTPRARPPSSTRAATRPSRTLAADIDRYLGA